MIPALSQVCTLHSPFEKDIEDYAAGQCRAVEVWLTKLETFLQSHSFDDVRRVLEANESTLPVASFQGGLLISQGDARREHWQHFTKRLDLCRELQIRTLVVAGDINSPIGEQDYERLCVSLSEAAKQAGDSGVRLALEFQPRAVYPNNLQSAAALVEQIGNPNLGLCLDAMYFFTGPSKESDLAYLSPENLFHVQLSDVAGQPREFCADSDRVLPGDGDFPLEIIVKRLREINYTGCVSVELMNPSIWQIPARQFGEVATTAVRKVLGLASM
jgi:2-keto-myo-inositol isomerase